MGAYVDLAVIFEYYGHIHVHVYCPGAGTDQPLGSIFSESYIFSPFVHFLQGFSFKRHFNNFPHFSARATYFDLAVK